MSGEKEQSSVTSDEETVKRPMFQYEKEEKRYPIGEEMVGRFYANPSPPPYGMPPPRHVMEQHVNRGMMGRPMSPHGRLSEDSDLTDAMIFLNRIKEEYSDNLQVYDNFLETMRDFKFEKIDADEVCKAVRILFKDKPYLIRLFDEYLPHHLRFMETRGGFDMQQAERPKFNQFRAPGPFMNQPMHMGQMPPNQQMHMTRMGHQVPPTFISRPMRQSPPPMAMHPEAIPRFKPQPVAPPTTGTSKNKAQEFVQLVKQRYQNKQNVYRQFVDLLQNSKSSFEKLFSQVSALLHDSPDLIEKFNKNFNTTKEGTQAASEPLYVEENDPLKKIKQTLREQGTLEQFLKIINFYNQNYISTTDLVKLVEPLIDDRDNMIAFKSFIKYEESQYEVETNRARSVDKVGSYKILQNKPTNQYAQSPLSADVINLMLVSVSTLESEEDTYVFRPKNHAEELLARIVDERSEADLMIDRLKFLVIKLEELYDSQIDGEIEMSSIQMSSALVKETLKKIYENKSLEVLESILTNPKKAIPVVLKRLSKVFKESMEKMREYRKFWRSMLEENYYKAYDTKGVYYRAQEKNYLSMRFIKGESEAKMHFMLSDDEIFDIIRDLFTLFIKNHSTNGNRKAAVNDQLAVFDATLESLKKDTKDTVVNFDNYSLFYYILTLYTRFKEIKDLSLPNLTSNPMAVSINLQEEFSITDRFGEIKKAAEALMRKEIDASRFEENVRYLSNCVGYKLYNLKKIMTKIEKQINVLLDGNTEKEESETEEDGQYTISKEGNNVILCKI